MRCGPPGSIAEGLECQQRARDPIAREPEPEVDDVAGLLAAERPFAPSQLIEHVTVADRRHRDLDPGRLHRLWNP